MNRPPHRTLHSTSILRNGRITSSHLPPAAPPRIMLGLCDSSSPCCSTEESHPSNARITGKRLEATPFSMPPGRRTPGVAKLLAADATSSAPFEMTRHNTEIALFTNKRRKKGLLGPEKCPSRPGSRLAGGNTLFSENMEL